MSENIETEKAGPEASTDAAEVDAAAANEATDEATEGAPEEPESGKGSRREAKYRTERNDARAERDALAERLTVLQSREVERLAQEQLADGGDLWRDGLELDALLDGDGNVDPKRVTAAARDLVKSRPHWAKPGPADPKRLQSGGTGSNGVAVYKPFEAAFSRRR